MKLHFLLLQDDEGDQHAGFAMAPLVTKGTPVLMSSVKRPASESSVAARSIQASITLFLSLVLSTKESAASKQVVGIKRQGRPQNRRLFVVFFEQAYPPELLTIEGDALARNFHRPSLPTGMVCS